MIYKGRNETRIWFSYLSIPTTTTRSTETTSSLQHGSSLILTEGSFTFHTHLPTQQSMRLQWFSESIFGKVCSLQTRHSRSCPSQVLYLSFTLPFLPLRDSRAPLVSTRSFASPSGVCMPSLVTPETSLVSSSIIVQTSDLPAANLSL